MIIEPLRDLLLSKHVPIEEWFEAAFAATPPTIYSSVDVRHAGYKLAPVDTNLFPAGFNNLSAAARQRAVVQFTNHLKRYGTHVSNILLIPENHTRNLGYLNNLHVLRELIAAAGFSVELGSLAAPSGEPVTVADAAGNPMVQHPLIRRGNTLVTESGFIPDVVVLNNDLTSGAPELLQGVTQPIIPPLGQGWYRRKKSIHFAAYDKVAQAAASVLGIDHWLISAISHHCGRVDFGERAGMECVAMGVEKVLHGIRTKYAEHGISSEPYVFIKADAGTYGMGIMTARSGEEVLEINKKSRNKMKVIKEGVASTEVIIQEGVPTADKIDGMNAEPMLYLVNGVPVGGAYRVNSERDAFGNLNASGMSFRGMCDEQEMPDDGRTTITKCSFLVFGFIARLATLAASREDYGDDWVI